MPAPLTLPVISIAPYLSSTSSPSEKEAVSSALHQACRDIGFFYLRVDDMLSGKEMGDVLQIGREFFGRPTEEKEELGLGNSDGARGYQKLHQNVTQGLADHHEGLDLYAPSPYPEGEDTAALPLSGANQWPKNPTRFRPTLETWIGKMKELGMTVMRAMADGLGMTEAEWLELKDMVEESFWVVRMIGYPPLPAGAPGISCGAHKDYGCLTLLHTDDTPRALQVFLRPTPSPDKPPASEDEGVWIDANPMEGCFVVNVGEMWEIWSNGLYRSTLHRVVHRSPTYRVSLPFFYEPAFEAFVQPLAAAKRKQKEEGWVLDGGKVYKGIKYGDFLVGKVTGNFDTGKEKKGRY